jgi:hypothetical protein
MPLPAARLIDYSRLTAPPEHLGVLVEPTPARLHEVLRQLPNRQHADTPLLDSTVATLRRELHAHLQLAGPIILSGHQAEFFHAGVFAKTIAAHAIARQLAGQAVFLTVDSDVPKTAQLALPQATSHGLRRIDVAIPGCDLQRSFEDQARVSRAEWLQFFASATSLYEFGDRSLLPTFARACLTTADSRPRYCDALARAHAAAENALGLDGVRELRMSDLCATAAFRAFVAHILLDARRFAEHYNRAQAAYRQRHRVRTRGRPVPPLITRDDTIELPFWVLRPDEPRRRLFVTPHGDEIELSTDNLRIGRLRRADLARVASHADPWPLERDGWKIRPRALALSAFARLFLADLFIHGIGGAKYDEMMEDFVRGFFGTEPGLACCVSATMYLPLSHSGVRPADIAAARQQSRDLRYNPQRHISRIAPDFLKQRAELQRRGEELRAHQPQDHAARRLVYLGLRRVNEQILATDPWRSAEYDQRIQTLEEQSRLDRVALDREYFYALHPQETLQQLVAAVRSAVD